MKSPLHKDVYKQICDFMGEDLDTPACKEVAEHLERCPNCKVYLDTVKKTVTICQETEKEEEMSQDIKNRLFKILDLSELSPEKE
jgi:predicted anti-sigma-YlaC factor YlaD